MGNLTLLHDPQLAIVWSRRPSPAGAYNAKFFAKQAAQIGLIVTSGMAKGIDAIAHWAALHSHCSTLAVLGCGIDVIYPRCNAELAAEIITHGLIVSEYPSTTPPFAHHFPLRNRIISALSCGILVIEAGRKSGALITDRCGAELGKEVFAVPDSIHNPMSQGAHHLIKQGVKLVENLDDILVEIKDSIKLSLHPGTFQESVGSKADDKSLICIPALEKEHWKVLYEMGSLPMSVNELVTKCAMSAEKVCATLLFLELQNMVEQTNGKYMAVGKHTKNPDA